MSHTQQESIQPHPSNRKIILLGHQNLQNSLLMHYISSNTGLDCHVIDHNNACKTQLAHMQPLLLLIDAKLHEEEQIKQQLVELEQDQVDGRVAFINTPPESSLEGMIDWPMIAGIFYEDTSEQQLLKGVLSILEGEYWLPRKLLTRFLDQHRNRNHVRMPVEHNLTEREIQVLKLVATGATNTDIAEHLCVSMHTVKTHLYNIFKKVHAHNRMHAVNWAKAHLPDLVQD